MMMMAGNSSASNGSSSRKRKENIVSNITDLTDEEANTNLTMSHVAARAEVRALVSALNLPGVAL